MGNSVWDIFHLVYRAPWWLQAQAELYGIVVLTKLRAYSVRLWLKSYDFIEVG